MMMMMMLVMMEELIVSGNGMVREGDGGYIKTSCWICFLFLLHTPSGFTQFFCVH